MYITFSGWGFVNLFCPYYLHSQPPVPRDPIFWFSWRKKSGIRKALSKSQVQSRMKKPPVCEIHASLQTIPYKLEMNMLINMMKHEPLCTYVWTGALTLLTRWSLTTPWKVLVYKYDPYSLVRGDDQKCKLQ